MNKKLLIADDEPELREVIKEILEVFNFDIEMAQDGQEAIDKIKTTKYDLIISDQKMPKKSGLEVLMWMRSENIQTPFIIQTGHGQQQLHDEAAVYKVFAVLDKPWDQDLLIKTVKKSAWPVTQLLWIDLEMTGLQVEKEVIIEVAAIVTDLNFNEIECFETVVQQPQSFLDSMDSWNKEHHGASGLLAKIPGGMKPDLVEKSLIALVKKHFPDPRSKPILAGNSIAQDRLFIDKYFKELSNLLHYRMLDVTSWKLILNNKFGKDFKKKNQHRALDDIRESIEELKFYLSFIKG